MQELRAPRGKGAQPGNQNAVKRRLWMTSIRYEALKNDAEKIRGVVVKLFEMALDGDMDAIREIGERLDGKVKQTIVHEGDEDAPLTIQVTASAALRERIRGVLEKTSERVINGSDDEEARDD